MVHKKHGAKRRELVKRAPQASAKLKQRDAWLTRVREGRKAVAKNFKRVLNPQIMVTYHQGDAWCHTMQIEAASERFKPRLKCSRRPVETNTLTLLRRTLQARA